MTIEGKNKKLREFKTAPPQEPQDFIGLKQAPPPEPEPAKKESKSRK
jgi:hypothetical protein